MADVATHTVEKYGLRMRIARGVDHAMVEQIAKHDVLKRTREAQCIPIEDPVVRIIEANPMYADAQDYPYEALASVRMIVDHEHNWADHRCTICGKTDEFFSVSTR